MALDIAQNIGNVNVENGKNGSNGNHNNWNENITNMKETWKEEKKESSAQYCYLFVQLIKNCRIKTHTSTQKYQATGNEGTRKKMPQSKKTIRAEKLWNIVSSISYKVKLYVHMMFITNMVPHRKAFSNGNMHAKRHTKQKKKRKKIKQCAEMRRK